MGRSELTDRYCDWFKDAVYYLAEWTGRRGGRVFVEDEDFKRLRKRELYRSLRTDPSNGTKGKMIRGIRTNPPYPPRIICENGEEYPLRSHNELVNMLDFTWQYEFYIENRRHD